MSCTDACRRSLAVFTAVVALAGATGCNETLTRNFGPGENDREASDLEGIDDPDRDGRVDTEEAGCTLECPNGFETDPSGVQLCQCKPREGCTCEPADDPVCGTDNITYPNACEAGCRFAGVAYKGPCVETEPEPDGGDIEREGDEIACGRPCPVIDCAPGWVPGPPDECGCITSCVPGEGQEGDDVDIDIEPPAKCEDIGGVCGLVSPNGGGICPRGRVPAPVDLCTNGRPCCVPPIDEDEAEAECADIECPVPCPNGFVTDENGCRTCECAPFDQDTCTPLGGRCIPVIPGAVCPPGFADANGRAGCGGVGTSCCLPDACVCPPVYAPVCGVNGITYGSPCEARCAAVDIAKEGPCDGAIDCADVRCADGTTCVSCPFDPNCPFCDRCAPAVCVRPIEGCQVYSTEQQCVCFPGSSTNDGLACPPGYECLPKAADGSWGYCQAVTPRCRTAADCPPNNECRNGVCEPIVQRCRTDGDCPRGLTCIAGVCTDATTNTCEQTGGQCIPVVPGARCPEGTRTATDGSTCGGLGSRCCKPCTCPDIYAPVCAGDGRTYGNRCLAECAGAIVAYDGECRVEGRCTTDRDCPPAYLCDRVTRVCKPDPTASCETAGGVCEPSGPLVRCPAGKRPSTDFQCASLSSTCCFTCNCVDISDPVCGADGVSYPNPCAADCAGTTIAYNGPCRADGCTSDEQCAATNRICDIATNTCKPKPAECRTDRDCAAGLVCQGGTCGVAPPAGCNANADCETGLVCRDGVCRIGCTSNATCPVGLVCDPSRGICTEPAIIDRCSPSGGFCLQGGADVCPPGTFASRDATRSCAQPAIEACCVPCNCPTLFEPVCGADGVTYPNRCQADCNRVDVAAEGECPTRPCGADRDCGGSLVCINSICQVPPQGCIRVPPAGNCTCDLQGNCPSNWVCTDRTCFGGFCIGGTCVPPPTPVPLPGR